MAKAESRSFLQVERGGGTMSEGSQVKEMETQDGQEARDFGTAQKEERN